MGFQGIRPEAPYNYKKIKGDGGGGERFKGLRKNWQWENVSQLSKKSQIMFLGTC